MKWGDKMEKIGLVFSGGGGKGAYELGVWKALHEFGYDQYITGVAGTSIGGLNSAMFCIRDYMELVKLWDEAKVEKKGMPSVLSSKPVMKLDEMFKKIKIEDLYVGYDNYTRHPFLSTKKLRKFIMSQAKLDQLRNSDCECYIACHDYRRKKPIYFHLNRIQDDEMIYKILCATASIPVIFRPIRIGKKLLCDGGLSDNTPITPLYEAGFTKIIVVLLGQVDVKYQEKYQNAKIYTIMPSENMGNLATGCLNFYTDVIDERIERGYQETKEFLGLHPDIFEDVIKEAS